MKTTTEIIEGMNQFHKGFLLLNAIGQIVKYDNPISGRVYIDYEMAIRIIHNLMSVKRIITDAEVRSNLWIRQRISYADISQIARESVDLNYIFGMTHLDKAISLILDRLLWVVIECGLVNLQDFPVDISQRGNGW